MRREKKKLVFANLLGQSFCLFLPPPPSLMNGQGSAPKFSKAPPFVFVEDCLLHC